MKISDDTILLIEDGDGRGGDVCSWADFVTANDSAAGDDPEWLPLVKRNLETNGEHREGGGAAAFFIITLAKVATHHNAA